MKWVIEDKGVSAMNKNLVYAKVVNQSIGVRGWEKKRGFKIPAVFFSKKDMKVGYTNRMEN